MLTRLLTKTPVRRFSTLPATAVQTPFGSSWVDHIEKNVYLDYKPYPIQSHDDPKSKAFVPSELDEYKQKTVNESYNSVITRLKNDPGLPTEGEPDHRDP